MLYCRLPVELTPGKLTWLVVMPVEQDGLRITTMIFEPRSEEIGLQGF